MRKHITLAIITIAALVVSACNNTNSNKTIETKLDSCIASDSAVLSYTDYHFHLDTITAGVMKSCIFTYTNKGKAPLLVSNVFTSCGCVSITWDKEPLMTGQSNSIKFDITIQGPGHFKKAIVVKNNSVNEPVLTIRIEGVAVEKS